MKYRISILFAAMLFNSMGLTAQVQVSKEPRHKKVLENKYIRLLDVNIQPGDTSFFHIHSTPSVFLHFTTSVVCSQIKDKEWVTAKNTEGYAWYRSFMNDTLIHRVSNCDTVPFHVTDVELLSSYNPTRKLQPLPFTLLFENEKVIAYRLTAEAFNKQVIKGRGPMIAELVSGNEVIFYDTMNKKSTKIKKGKYLYIKPGTAFYFSATGDAAIDMVLFEIK
ncbi:MAG: hypothetical protein ABIP79_05535 [Chitinophagaceae bacterium]